MKYKFVLFVVLSIFQNSRGQDGFATCPIEDPESSISWSTGQINLPDVNNNVIEDVYDLQLTFTFSGPLTVAPPENPDIDPGDKYIDANAAEGALVINVNDNFKNNLEEDYRNQANIDSGISFIRNIILSCGAEGEKTLQLALLVTDTNNHFPAFGKDEYTYSMPMPLPPKADLTSFGEKIIVTDLDFSNKDVTFSIEPQEQFEISTDSLGNREYQAVLKVTEYKRYDDPITLTISATDSGDPEGKTSTTKITITKDPDNSLPDTPKFEKSVYNFKYSVVDNKPVIVGENGENPKVETSSPDKLKVSLDNDQYMTAVYDKATGFVTISSTGEFIDPHEDSVMTFILSAALDQEIGQTVILLEISNFAGKAPQFTQPIYKAQYKTDSEPHTVIFLDAKPECDEPSALISLEDNTNFEIRKDDDSNWVVDVNPDLDPGELAKGKDIVLKLIATLTNDQGQTLEGYSSLDIILPDVAGMPQFEKSNYLGNYLIGEQEDQLTDVDTIKVVNQLVDNLKVKCSADDPTICDKFDVVLADQICTVNFNGALDDSVLLSKGSIVLALQLTDETTDYGQTNLVVQLPKNIAHFESPVYTGSYKADDPPTIELDQGQTISLNTYSNTIQTSVEDKYKDYITFTCDETVCNLVMSKPLESSDVDSYEIIVNLQAKIHSATVVTTTGLKLKMPEKPENVVPEFSKPAYRGKYEDDGSGVHTLSLIEGEEITIVSDHADTTQIAVLEPYDTYFEWDNTNKGFTVKTDLPQDEIENLEIIVMLGATLAESLQTGRAVVVVDLLGRSKVAAPKFVQAFYKATYTIDNTITDDEPVTIVERSDSLDLIKITVDDSVYTNNFDIQYDIDNQWKITLKTNLDLNTLFGQRELKIPLKAHLDDSMADDTSVLVLTLPEPLIAFSKDAYTAYYKVNEGAAKDEVQIDGMDVTTGVEVNFVEGEHSTNFNIDCPDGICVITVVEDLSEDILNTVSEVILTIVAIKDGISGKVSIVLKLPLEDKVNAPEFTLATYRTTFDASSDQGALTVDPPIKIKDVADLSEMTLTPDGDFNDFIDFEKKGDFWEVSVNDPSQIEKEISVSLTLSVIKAGVSVPAKATLVINISNKEQVKLHFDKDTYQGSYTENDGLTIDDIALVGDTEGTAQVSFGNGLDEILSLFDLQYEGATQQVTITLKETPIPPEIIEKYASVVVSLVAQNDGYSTNAALLITLPKSSDPNAPQFTNVYTANYNIRDELDEVVLENGPIEVSVADDSIEISVEIEDDTLAQYFDLPKDADKWNLVVKVDLTDNILRGGGSLTVILKATQNDLVGYSAVVVKLPDQPPLGGFNFEDNYYYANYTNDASKPEIALQKNIVLTGETVGVNVEISADYKEYFDAKLNENTVAVTCLKALSDEILNTQSAIGLEVTATRNSDNVVATVILRLPFNDENPPNPDNNWPSDKTNLIIAISVLAVLLVASLVGSAVFYYLRYRRGKNKFTNEDDDLPRRSERFTKNNNTTDSKNKFEHPTRRPTGTPAGVVKLTMDDDDFGNDYDVPDEGRKSVQFDTVNVDEMEIDKPEEEDEDEETAKEEDNENHLHVDEDDVGRRASNA